MRDGAAQHAIHRSDEFGEFAEIEVEIVRATRSLVFLRGVMRVGDRVVATADGVWKILAWPGVPYKT